MLINNLLLVTLLVVTVLLTSYSLYSYFISQAHSTASTLSSTPYSCRITHHITGEYYDQEAPQYAQVDTWTA